MSDSEPDMPVAGEDPPPAPMPEEPTVGTGSVVAIGCSIATLVIIAVGVLLVLWLR